MSLVNQVVRVQGQGEQRHGKDLKFGGRSVVNNILSGYPVQFVPSLDLIRVT